MEHHHFTFKYLLLTILPFVLIIYLYLNPNSLHTLNSYYDEIFIQNKVEKNNIVPLKKYDFITQIDKVEKNIEHYEKTLLMNNSDLLTQFINSQKIETSNKKNQKQNINLSQYRLQMIYKSADSYTVVINDKIYKLYDIIDNNNKIKITKILSDKILLENPRGTRWLELIK